MESRAKQRLTGAVILVALFVLLVPELLTGPRNAHPPATSTNEDGMSSYTIDLDGHNPASAPTTPTTSDAAVSLPAVPAAAPASGPPAAARAAPGESATPEASTAKPTAANPVPPAARANNVAVAPVVSPPAAQPAHTEAARPEPPHATAPASAPSARPAAVGNFVVQLGTFSQRENAERLVRDMKAKGFAAFVLPVTTGGHELYRVRIGPTRDRASAEALAAQLKRAGQSSSIVPIS